MGKKLKSEFIKKLNKPVDNDIATYFQIIVGVLFSVALGSFLLIIPEQVPEVSNFIHLLISITAIYTFLIYLFAYYKLKVPQEIPLL
ncbi:MAG: hypothetical protein KJ718_06415 [Nanoarchaeota archaeon]|nr:hypothetical protein [Nanoarchaeota archaeon]MBU1052151.1 hypothetical protein [Nanoarchaeota archaeon]